jgi:flagellar basal body-associated protein FliL
MADQKAEAAPAKDAPAAPAKGPNPIITMVLVAVVAGGASFGGVKLGSAAKHGAGGHEAGAPSVRVMKAPGPTIPLEPFILSINDAQGHAHAMKVTLAIEMEAGGHEEPAKVFLPRVRDATLAYLRALTYEEASQPARMEKARNDLLDKYLIVGFPGAERILITDLVLQ